MSAIDDTTDELASRRTDSKQRTDLAFFVSVTHHIRGAAFPRQTNSPSAIAGNTLEWTTALGSGKQPPDIVLTINQPETVEHSQDMTVW